MTAGPAVTQAPSGRAAPGGLAAPTRLRIQGAKLSFQYTVSLSDPTGAFTAQQSTAILANLRGAMDIFSRHIDGLGTLDVVVVADLSGRTVGSGRSMVAVNKGDENGKTVNLRGRRRRAAHRRRSERLRHRHRDHPAAELPGQRPVARP